MAERRYPGWEGDSNTVDRQAACLMQAHSDMSLKMARALVALESMPHEHEWKPLGRHQCVIGTARYPTFNARAREFSSSVRVGRFSIARLARPARICAVYFDTGCALCSRLTRFAEVHEVRVRRVAVGRAFCARSAFDRRARTTPLVHERKTSLQRTRASSASA